MTTRRRFLAMTLALVTALSGCENPERARAEIESRLRRADELAAQAALPAAPAAVGTVAMHDGIWVGGRSVRSLHGDPLPAKAEGAGAVVLNSAGAPLQLKEIVTEISAQTGLPVEWEEAPTPANAAASPNSGANQNPQADAAGKLPPTGMAVAWSGPLSGLLDGVAVYFGMQWDFRGGQLRLFRNEVRTFTLAALPSNSTVKAGINTSRKSGGTGGAAAGAGGGEGASGSMLQDISNETTIKLWDDIRDTVQSMIPSGGKLTMSPATGTVTVVAPPGNMRRIAAYIEEQNERITRQVTVSVRVLRVDIHDNYDLGLSLTTVFQRLSGQYAVNLVGPGPAGVAAGTAASYTLSGLRTLDGGKQQVNGQAVIDALQVMGKVALVTEASVTTLNGQAAPVSVAEERNYVAAAATTVGGTLFNSQTQLTPATLVTGFNMQILPRILENGEVLLQYGLSLSDLKSLDEFGDTSSKVQLPDVNVRSFLQQAILRSGDLLVLAGYQSTTDAVDDRGLPGIGASPLGGSIASSRSRSVIVIMMTPEILVRPNSRGGA